MSNFEAHIYFFSTTSAFTFYPSTCTTDIVICNYGNYYDCTDFDGTDSLNAAEMFHRVRLHVGSHLRPHVTDATDKDSCIVIVVSISIA